MKSHPKEILTSIEKEKDTGTGSRKRMFEIIRNHLDVSEFVQTVRYAYDPFKQFFLTTVPGLANISRDARRIEKEHRKGLVDIFAEEDDEKWEDETQFERMFALLDDLSSRKLPPNSNHARNAVLEWAKHCGSNTIDIFRKILNKDLRCGLSEKSFNKIKPDWIPTFDVQLAKPFDEKNLHFPCYVDPKFDGQRCVCHVDPNTNSVIYLSRNGNQFFNYDCFTDDLCTIFAGMGMVTVDAEVISTHGFQKLMKAPKYKDPNYDTTNLALMVFDWMPTPDFESQNFDLVQSRRYEELKRLFSGHPTDSKVRLVDTRVAKDFQEVEKIFEHWVNQGLEGMIMKQPAGKYEFKRTDSWMKLKPTHSEEFEIIGIEEGESGKQWEGKTGSIVVQRTLDDGRTMKVGVASGLTHYMHENIVVAGDDIIYTQPDGEVINLKGRLVEVVYDCVTDDGSLRFPRFKPHGDVLIRTDK